MKTQEPSPTRDELNFLWPSLTGLERDLLRPLVEKGPPLWYPLRGPQLEAFLTKADELFYGGAAGGGKTDLLLGLALRAHTRSIIFRREYPQLKAIIDRSRELIGDAGRYNGQDNVWRFDDGRILEFGAVQYDTDVRKYQGRPHDLKAFDELPNFTEFQYRFLIGWTRTTVPGQRTRVVSAGNPPTNAEGEWVIRRWGAWLDPQHHNPARPGELRWYATVDGEEVERADNLPFSFKGEEIRPKSRTFVPARLADNPFLMATDYGAQLQAMPEPLRSQLLYGDFTAGTEDDPWQVIPTDWIRQAQARWTPERPALPMTAIGVDVARGGSDKTVLAPRYGHWFGPLQRHPGQSTPSGQAVAGLVIEAIAGEGSDVAIHVDVIGVGASSYDILAESGDLRVIAVNFAEGSQATDRSGRLKMANRRAEAWWRMRESLDPVRGDGIALPPDTELLSDLCAPRWSVRTSGILVESKEDIKKRLGRSPDCGDAVVMANMEEQAPLLLW
jgi:hypothetical protein